MTPGHSIVSCAGCSSPAIFPPDNASHVSIHGPVLNDRSLRGGIDDACRDRPSSQRVHGVSRLAHARIGVYPANHPAGPAKSPGPLVTDATARVTTMTPPIRTDETTGLKIFN